MFSPNRQLEGREPDGVKRKTIEVAITGRREQSLRFDPFSLGAHWHIRPAQGRGQIQLQVAEGQDPLEVILAFFDDVNGFRYMLEAAEHHDEVVDFDQLVTGDNLAHAVGEIRAIDAAQPAA